MYIEDYLELFAGIHREQKELKFFCSKKDEVLMFSLGKQVLRQTALTDRQHELAKKKLLEYKEQFDVYGFDDFEKEKPTNTAEALAAKFRNTDSSEMVL